MNASSWACTGLIASLLALAPLTSQAERTPPRAGLPTEAPASVIVAFKPDAALTRRFALAATADGNMARSVLAQRASALGTRMGHVLQAGAALSERVQVARAAGVDARTLAQSLAADPDVEYAVVNGRRHAVAAPNDPLYAAAAKGVRPLGPDVGQWYLRAPAGEAVAAIDIETAWARTTGSASVVVAVLDTGVRFDHPDLGRTSSGGPLLPGYDFVSDTVVANDGDGRDADPSDPGDWVTSAEALSTTFGGCGASNSSWHGTGTASLVAAAANNGIGMAGTAPGVRVLPLRVLGKCYGDDADIIAAMRWAAGLAVPGVPNNPNPAKVLNLSLGGDGACGAAYQSAVDDVLATGAVVVAAAGNSAGLAVGAPANCKGVISVLGLRHVGTKVGFSDLGPEITIGAPGGNCVTIGAGDPCQYPILAASNAGALTPGAASWTDSYHASVGTSFAAPLVAGTVALMVSLNPGLTPAQVTQTLQSTARPFPSSGVADDPTSGPVTRCVAPTSTQQAQCYCNSAVCGAGMLNAGAAVAAVATAPPSTAGNGGGGGGGASSPWWLALLATAVVVLWFSGGSQQARVAARPGRKG